MNDISICSRIYLMRKTVCKQVQTPATLSQSEYKISSAKPKPEDWLNPNPLFPKLLYTLDYFVGAGRKFNSKTAKNCRSNRQVQEDWAVLYAQTNDERYNIISLVRTAEHCFHSLHTLDFRDSRVIFSNLFYAYGHIGTNIWMTNKYANAIKANNVVSFGRMITDRSLVYVDTDGRVRVRGYACVYISQGSAQYRKECGFKRGWNFFVVEFAFTYMKTEGWRFSPYVVSRVQKMDEGTEITPEQKLNLINRYGGIALQKRTRSLHVRDKSA